MSDLHVVFGTGPLGLALMRALRARGKRVRLLNRSSRVRFPKDLQTEVGGIDAVDPAQTREVCEGAAVVYHCIGLPYSRWQAELPAIARGIIEGAAYAGARLVYADNLYAYGRVHGPIRDGLPETSHTRKGALRAAIARIMLEAHAAGKVSVSIGRAADFYGPWVTNAILGERVFARALKHTAADLPGNVDRLHTFTYIDDFAEALVTLGAREDASGRTWIVPSAPALTTRAMVDLVYRAVGTRSKVRVAPSWTLALFGYFNHEMDELREMLYQFEDDFVVDHSAYARQFEVSVTSHAQGIARTLDWYHNERPLEVPARFRRRPLDQ